MENRLHILTIYTCSCKIKSEVASIKQPNRIFPNFNFVPIITTIKQPYFVLSLGCCLTQVRLYVLTKAQTTFLCKILIRYKKCPYLLQTSGPDMATTLILVSMVTAFTSRDLPQPLGPNSSTPLGGGNPEINVLKERLKKQLWDIWHVRIASDTQKIQSSDWPKLCCAL